MDRKICEFSDRQFLFSKEVQNLERGAYPIGGTSYRVDQLGGTLQDYFQNKFDRESNPSSANIWKTVYSALNMNKNLAPTKLKIDGSYTNDPKTMADNFNVLFMEKIIKRNRFDSIKNGVWFIIYKTRLYKSYFVKQSKFE